MSCHLPDADVKKRCDGPHGRLRQRNRKNHATAAEWHKELALLRNSVQSANLARRIRLFFRQKKCMLYRQNV